MNIFFSRLSVGGLRERLVSESATWTTLTSPSVTKRCRRES